MNRREPTDSAMKSWNSVAIVGVGLLGGSIGLGLLRRQLTTRVIGIGRNETSLRRARDLGAITEFATEWDHERELPDLVIVCTPVGTVARIVLEFARRANDRVVITDVGSTKVEILQSIAAGWPGGPAQFIGSHPLAGSDKTGPEHADANLLQGRTVVVTPETATPAHATDEVTSLWTELGARVHVMTADEHDRALAWVSHLPHVVAAALAAVTPIEHLPLAASGWRDTTRIAGGDTSLWSQIVASNRENLQFTLEAIQQRLQELNQALLHNDPTIWERLLNEGRERRDSVAD